MKLRKEPLAADVRDALELAPRERVLAWADDGSGRAVVASESALHLQRVPPAYTRVGWEQIEHASYEAGVMTVTLSTDLDSATLRVPVGGGPQLPVVIRDRVTASVLVDRHVALEGDAGVRIVGRRSAAGDVTWRADLDAEIAGEPGAAEAAEVVLRDVQAEVLID